MNVEFYKFFWDDLGEQLFSVINHFFLNAVMPKAWGKIYVTLIPKKEHPKSITDYRPISLCNVAYKIVTKILANHLKNIVASLVDNEQCGFIPGRSPIDNIIAIHEMVHSIHQDKTIPPRMLIKVNIEKAYGTLHWDVILANLAKMQFPSIWISYIKTYLSAISFSLIINGTPTYWFQPTRGVKHKILSLCLPTSSFWLPKT